MDTCNELSAFDMVHSFDTESCGAAKVSAAKVSSVTNPIKLPLGRLAQRSTEHFKINFKPLPGEDQQCSVVGTDERIEIRGITFFPALRIVQYCDREVVLSSRESMLLDFFMKNADQYFSAAQIFQKIWCPQTDATPHGTVRVHMKHLRNRLESLGINSLIITVRGAGYVLRDKSYLQIKSKSVTPINAQ